jgi:hypothetical protein
MSISFMLIHASRWCIKDDDRRAGVLSYGLGPVCISFFKVTSCVGHMVCTYLLNGVLARAENRNLYLDNMNN